MQLPGVNTKKLGDLIEDVTDALQQRSDLSDDFVCRYLRKALLEITESNPFEELRITTDTVTGLYQSGVNTYPVTDFVPSQYDYTQITSLAVFIDSPTDTIAFPMDYMTPKAIEPMLFITGAFPVRWTRFGSNILCGPKPNQNYDGYVRVQVRHPFNEQNLMESQLHITSSWEDIIAYAAAQRIAVVKRWNDQATYLHNLLWGDPDYQMSGGKKGRPGLIQARRMQQERDEDMNSRQMKPRIMRYCAR
jgi:hypothetical protein